MTNVGLDMDCAIAVFRSAISCPDEGQALSSFRAVRLILHLRESLEGFVIPFGARALHGYDDTEAFVTIALPDRRVSFMPGREIGWHMVTRHRDSRPSLSFGSCSPGTLHEILALLFDARPIETALDEVAEADPISCETKP